MWALTNEQLPNQARADDVYSVVMDQAVYDAVGALMAGTSHPPRRDSICSATSNVRVSRVWRVENFKLWKKDRDCCRQLQDECASRSATVGPPAPVRPLLGSMSQDMREHVDVLSGPSMVGTDGLNRKWLFHGASYETAGTIASDGFDFRVAKRGMHGAGNYVASEACKAHRYTCKKHKSGCWCDTKRYMVFARVLLGRPCFTKEVLGNDFRRPPEKNVDSVVANPGPMQGHHRTRQDHQEIVIFENCQSYPDYIVERVLAPPRGPA